MSRLPFITPVDVQRAIPEIIAHLRSGGLIAYPTETVYGFGGLVRDDALGALAMLKSRDEAKPFLLLISETTSVAGLKWNAAARKLANAFWPGPLTLALPVEGDLPARILSSEGAVAVRSTPHDGLRALLAVLGEPITSTSANAPGKPPAMDADEVESALTLLEPSDVLILDGGRLPASSPSTVVDCSTEVPRIVRAGAITAEALGQLVELSND